MIRRPPRSTQSRSSARQMCIRDRFGILKQADPALVDPGVTARLECLLDDVVVGKQEMIGAIDAVCDVAQRIIGKLKEGATLGGPPLLGAAVGKNAGGYPPTPAMKRFADSLVRQKGIKPPPGYKTSISICRKLLNAVSYTHLTLPTIYSV